MESIYVGYAAADRDLGQALVIALQRTGAQVWDDSALQHASDIDQATVFQACHQFVLVVSRASLQSQELRSQTLHYVTLHHRASDAQMTLVMRERLLTRDLWLFVRHFPRIEQDDLSESGLLAQVKQSVTTTTIQRRPSRRLSTLVQRAGLVQGALATPPRYRRSWARTWRIQIIAATSVLIVLVAFLVSSTLLVKHTIIDHQPLTFGRPITPTAIVLPTATVGLKPIYQASSTPLPHPSPTTHATPTTLAAAPDPTDAAFTPTPTPTPTPTLTPTPIPLPRLDLPLNNAGISDDSNTTEANYDSFGYSYSAQTLQAAGFTSGASITLHGVSFKWPSFGAGTPDNVVPNGQVITLTPAPVAKTITFLGSATYGPASGTGTLTYTDGSTQPFTLEFSDWALGTGPSSPYPDNTIVATLPYRNTNQSTQEAVTVYVFSTQITLTPGKALASVTLPANSGPGTLHILSIGIK